MATEAQVRANRENALKSTGPRSAEGKARSSRNALTHGLTASGAAVAGDEAELLAKRTAEWTEARRPTTEREAWLVEVLALASVRIHQCRLLETAHRIKAAERAALAWEADREAETEDVAARLHRDPARTVAKLLQTLPGALWLLERWAALEDAATATGRWDESQRALALDLLGTPAEFRSTEPRLPVTATGAELARIALDEQARLNELIDGGLSDLDDLEQDLSRQGFTFDLSAPARLIRRYQSEAWKTLWWADRELKASRQGAEPAPRNEPNAPAPQPAPRPEPAAPRPEPRPAQVAQPAPIRVAAPEPPLNRKARRAAEALQRSKR